MNHKEYTKAEPIIFVRDEDRPGTRVKTDKPEQADSPKDDPLRVDPPRGARNVALPRLNTPGPRLNTLGPRLNTLGPRLNTPEPRLNAPAAYPVANAPAAFPDLPQLDGAIDEFWSIIDKLQWRNASDGLVDRDRVVRVINNVDNDAKKMFKKQYKSYYTGAVIQLTDNGVFARNNIVSDDDRARIVSHAIGLGQNQFETLMDEPDLLQFLIDQNECQSLNSMLPAELQA